MTHSPEYVAARAVLLDALDILGSQRRGVVLVGAQAICIRVGDSGLAVSLHTTDADLGLIPDLLAATPELAACMTRAGFRHDSASSVGIWVADRVIDGAPGLAQVDLLVPDAVSGRAGEGKRRPDIPPHDPRAARIVRGIEGALFDHDTMRVGALDPTDARAFDVAVAGPAALVIAKAHKIRERLGQVRRANTVAKDALDVLRVLRGTSEDDVAERWCALLAEGTSPDTVRIATAVVARDALEFVRSEFAVAGGRGCELAVQAAIGTEEPAMIRASLAELARRVVTRIDRGRT